MWAMPRVTADHMAARRRQILDAAARCFSRNGFHATSMQDVLAEAGLSAGAVYRYFPSKEALIREIASDTINCLVDSVVAVVRADPPLPLLDALAAILKITESRLDSHFRLALQAWGEALRNPQLAACIAERHQQLRMLCVEIAQLARDRGELPADSDPEQAGVVLFSIVIGFMVQNLLTGDSGLGSHLAGFRAVLGATPRPC